MGAGELCRPRFPIFISPLSSSAECGHGPWLPLLSSPQHREGLLTKARDPGSLGGLHGGGPLLESREKLGAGSDLNPRVPGEAKLPHPGAKGWTLAGAPAPGPATPGAPQWGVGSAGCTPALCILTITQGLGLLRSRIPLRRPLPSHRAHGCCGRGRAPEG